MIVTPIASTILLASPASIEGTAVERDMSDTFVGLGSSGIDQLAEFAGRSCYQSWEKPNPKTATNEGYMQNIIDQGHFSVFEHGSVTFYVEGVSRALTHELIRHRHLSYSELSQRFVDMSDAKFIDPPLLQGIEGIGIEDSEVADDFRSKYEELVQVLTEAVPGAKRKEIREAARAVMPNATETKIVVTGNLRAWRDVLAKRWHEAADAEIREFAGEVLGHLRYLAPASVQDIPTTPYTD